MKLTEWLKQHWKPVAIVGAGVIGIWLYMRSRAAGGAAAPSDTGAGLPATGAAPLGNQTPFSPTEALAGQYASQLLGQQQYNAASGISMYATPQLAGTDKGGHQEYSYGTGAISKAWQEVIVNGQQMWEDIYHPGHIISEQQAQALSPQDKGPYASPENAITPLNILKKAAAAYFSSQTGAPPPNFGSSGDVPAPSVSPVPIGPPIPGGAGGGTAGIASRSRTPGYGNSPAPTAPGQIGHVV